MNAVETVSSEKVKKRLVSFSPLNIPRERRLQTLTCLIWGSLMATSMAVFLYVCSIPQCWPALIAYLLWVFVYDDAPNRGGRPNDLIRKSAFWKYFANYFPISLIKTVDLDPTRTYIFGCKPLFFAAACVRAIGKSGCTTDHPHGIIGVGAMANFGSDATNFSQQFPGIKPHLLTLASNFQLPFYRDLLLALSICSVSYKSCANILRQGPGNSITIVVGGAAEALSARPGTADLTLRKRLGFLKLAIREGADLVPIFSFGENDIFNQLANQKGTRLRTLQKRFQKAFGFTLPIFFGRGIFNYSLGLMPYRHPIVTVVGRPISVVKCANPTPEMIEDVQQRYIEELIRLWDSYKDMYASSRKRELSIVD